MKRYLKLLKNTKLFGGITETEIEEMLECLSAEVLRLSLIHI